MQWNSRPRRAMIEAGELARRIHSEWLTEALRSGREYPRIPLRRVDEGGFERLMSRPGGPELASSWWRAAINRLLRLDSR